MKNYSLLLNLISVVLSVSAGGKEDKYVSGDNTDQAAALQFLQNYNDRILKFNSLSALAAWDEWNNSTEVYAELQDFEEEAWKNATSFAWKNFKDTNKTAYRMFKKLSNLEINALPREKFDEYHNLLTDMDNLYFSPTSRVCSYYASSNETCHHASSESGWKENCIWSKDNAYPWCEWSNGSAKIMKDKFIQYVELANEAAKLNGFSDMGEMWREAFESEDFKGDVEDLWQTLKPFYEQFHAYVRQKLRKQYPFSGIKADGPIPAHLVGKSDWNYIFDMVCPYPNEKYIIDVTEAMEAKNMTQLDMYKMSEEFLTSLGLIEMTPEFWNRSILMDSNDTIFSCSPSEAASIDDERDFRIRMCAEVNMEDFMTIHHEMGHVEYFLQYAKQPAVFRNSPNPGFHEAVGDTISLSVRTPEHLKKIGLLEEVSNDKETEINELFRTALEKIVYVPFAYWLDNWNWKVFDGSINEEELNQKYWEMSLQYRGICPPVRRTNEDFDTGFMFSMGDDSSNMRYYVADVIQFQFHKALCEAAGHQGPLHKCDIYNSKKAGKLLSDMLSKGSSEHWEEAMSAITNGKSRKMDTAPMMEYFAPLIDWLKEQNKNETLGWKSGDPMICP